MPMVCRGLGGGEFTFDLPLPLHARDQLERGELTVLELTGDDQRPDQNAKREEWALYLQRVHSIPEEEVQGESKADLIAWADELEESWTI